MSSKDKLSNPVGNLVGNPVRNRVDINTRIAGRVRELRTARALSLEKLASRSGVSRSMLSLIERGEASPTAVVLAKVAAGLGQPLAALFDDTSAAVDPLSTAADREAWRDPKSGYVRRNISPQNYPSPVRIVEVELPPGAEVAYEDVHRTPGIHQQVWLLEGTLDLRADGATYRLRSGDCLAMTLDQPTAFRNPTRKRTRYAVVIVAQLGDVAWR